MYFDYNKFINIDEELKPKDWPANAIELKLDEIKHAMDEFFKEPNFQNKGKLLACVTEFDLNQFSVVGMVRTTKYEVACINSLLTYSLLTHNTAVKVYLYKIIKWKTHMQKFFVMTGLTDNLLIDEYQFLLPQLLIFHIAHSEYIVDKNDSFANKIIGTINQLKSHSTMADNKLEEITFITQGFLSMLNDISYFECSNTELLFAFERNELHDLFKVVAMLIRDVGDNPCCRPLKGVLMTCISNYVLKSRYNYNHDYICKYVSGDVSEKSIINEQIWLRPIASLNDEMEGLILPKMFEKTEWLGYSWCNKIELAPTRIYYLSSFCKNVNDIKMKSEYGECIYGYKTDVVGNLISPINICATDTLKIPFFTQIIAFDVLYDENDAKEEIKFLCSLIDEFYITDEEKNDFLQEILQYWKYSVKEEKWSYEKERRYVLFLYDEYDYLDIDRTDDRFLKIKSSIFQYPDFVMNVNDNVKTRLKQNNTNRYRKVTKPYILCNECLNIDFDNVMDRKKNLKNCPICGSKNLVIINPEL